MHSALAERFSHLRSDLRPLVVCLSHSWGGLEQVAAADTMELAMVDLHPKIVTLEGTPVHQMLQDKPGLEVIALPYRPRNTLDWKLRSDIRHWVEGGVNLIHLHQPSLLGSVSPWLWKYPDVALIATRHIMSTHFKRDPIHRLIYSRVDALVAMSESLKKNILATHGIPETRVRVIRLGLDYDRFDPDRVDPAKQRALFGADDKTVVIGLVGRIDPAKGQGTFIKAAAGLLKNLRPGERVKFVIVGDETLGAGSKHLAELQAMVTQFRLEDYIVFAGFQSNIPEIMRSFDLFVMPSRQEAFGLVAIEAMAMECPIIISSGGSAEEIVGSEEYGLMVRPDDAFDLQRQIRALLDNPRLRLQMGKKGREYVRTHFDRQRRLTETLELYERALRRRALVK